MKLQLLLTRVLTLLANKKSAMDFSVPILSGTAVPNEQNAPLEEVPEYSCQDPAAGPGLLCTRQIMTTCTWQPHCK